MQVYVTRRGDRYHSTPECPRILSAQRSARSQGYEVHPPLPMSLAEAEAWKPVQPCPACWTEA
ncbi:hypothetical protein ACWEWD_34410 [Streptomyces tendae]